MPLFFAEKKRQNRIPAWKTCTIFNILINYEYVFSFIVDFLKAFNTFVKIIDFFWKACKL